MGLLGAGKTELARGLFGAEPFPAGSVELDGRPYAPRRPSDAIRGGVHLVPEDRHADALVPGWSLAQNISLPFLKSLAPLSAAGLVNRSREDALGRDTIEPLGVVARDEHSTVEELSGGNQQKVVVGRWLAERPASSSWTNRSEAWTSAPVATSAAAPAPWPPKAPPYSSCPPTSTRSWRSPTGSSSSPRARSTSTRTARTRSATA